jgi:hypothetical protein
MLIVNVPESPLAIPEGPLMADKSVSVAAGTALDATLIAIAGTSISIIAIVKIIAVIFLFIF